MNWNGKQQPFWVRSGHARCSCCSPMPIWIIADGLPLLARRGFRGEIIATAATRELAKSYCRIRPTWPRRMPLGDMRRAPGTTAAPLYTQAECHRSWRDLRRVASYGRRYAVTDDLRVSFFDAGHILGSAHVLAEVSERGRARRVLFSGDIGGAGRPIIRDPDPPPAAIVLMETTYGDRCHRSTADSVSELVGAIATTVGRGGNVVIPSFALERTQEILYWIRAAIASGSLPPQLPVYVDSPMAVSATAVYRAHPECYDEDAAKLFSGGQDLFGFPGLHLVRATSDSIAINGIGGGAVIMAGSGMCTGGRVRHHLVHNLPRAASSIVFVGYAASGTPARRIIDGARSIHAAWPRNTGACAGPHHQWLLSARGSSRTSALA